MVTSEARDLRFVSEGKILELERFFERWLKAQWKIVEQLLNAAILSKVRPLATKILVKQKTKNKNKQKTQK